MTTARNQIVSSDVALYYHITSRCVQRAWLMGTDRLTGRNYDHRREWFINQLRNITPAFSLSVETYAVMSNHFHLVVYYDPQAHKHWSDEEVVRRWFLAHPTQYGDSDCEERKAIDQQALLNDPQRLRRCREH